ncbi:cyclic nucleotide-binding domain-containing protein [Microcoleus sp. FACHB-1515]|uniref:cyclic nucleotide-binding domain-containing protein n=1 Tax=Cyanophyceae TaxID=3028117 RepID=UPI0016842AE3|nr:cyclic nucleotide-binding domain-containing protein [Microcoleus sp. FACHB-1515]MBD2092319.1 cyclic nucleotide-binding domain-containing protein [Microcoleus sp. FACHB-1515]
MKQVLFILGELSDADIDWLIQTGDRQDVEPGTILIHEGKSVDALYILLEGTLVVTISALEGRQIARLASGDVVGEMSFVESRPPSATVQTLEKSVVLAVPRSLLSEKLQTDVGFAARFYRALAILLSSRLRGTVRQLSNSPDRTQTETETAAIAQQRFDNLLERLKGNESA